MITQFPGFPDPVHDAQQTFRALLTALARPGILQTTAVVTPPAGLLPSCAAACLTLLDLETTVWLQPGFSQAIWGWLQFHTGCRLAQDPHEAQFALIGDVTTAPSLDTFNWGTPESPEASTSLLIQCPERQGSASVTLQGPGIRSEISVALPLPADFWQQWQQMTTHYPQGVDAWCFTDQQVFGLPRTAHVSLPAA